MNKDGLIDSETALGILMDQTYSIWLEKKAASTMPGDEDDFEDEVIPEKPKRTRSKGGAFERDDLPKYIKQPFSRKGSYVARLRIDGAEHVKVSKDLTLITNWCNNLLGIKTEE